MWQSRHAHHAAKRHRYESELGLSAYDTRVLTDDHPISEYFEATIATGANIKQAVNWIMGDITAYLKNEKCSVTEIALKPEGLAELIALIEAGTISGKIAKDLLPELLAQGGSPKALVESKGLIQLSDPTALGEIIDQVLIENPKELEQYHAGKTKLQGFFVGQIMKKTGGRADPKLTNQLLGEKLKK